MRLIALGGSLRAASWNQRIAEIAGRGAAAAGAEVTVLRLHDFPMPLFNEDEESASGPPEGALALRTAFREHDGLILGVPEYNGGPPAALKNAIDWLSRPQEGFGRLDCFAGKVCALVSCSPGALGGIRGLPITRTILSSLGMHVIPAQHCLSGVHECFDEHGEPCNEQATAALEGVGRAVAEATVRLRG